MTAIKDFFGDSPSFYIFWESRALLEARDLLPVQLHVLDGHIPMSSKDFKSALLFLRILSLVGPKLFLQRIFVERLIRNRRILEHDGHAIVPAPVFGRVVARLVHPDLEHAAHLHLLLQQRVVVLLEQLQKLVRISPLRLVIVFDHEGLAGFGCGLGRERYWQQSQKQQQESQFHRSSPWGMIVAHARINMRRKGSRRVIQCLAAKDLPDGVSPKEEDDEKNILT